MSIQPNPSRVPRREFFRSLLGGSLLMPAVLSELLAEAAPAIDGLAEPAQDLGSRQRLPPGELGGAVPLERLAPERGDDPLSDVAVGGKAGDQVGSHIVEIRTTRSGLASGTR
jgi:hypothetical protein